jgi:hypothetical protein
MIRQKLTKPVNPEAVAAMANALERVSNNSHDMTTVEQRLSKRLASARHRQALVHSPLEPE